MIPEEISQTMEQRVAELLEMLDIQAGVKVDTLALEGKNYLEVTVNAENEGAELIGHHGSRLKALSTVLSMMVPESDERISVLLDINGYRDQRTSYIESQAEKAMAEAIETLQPVELEPMSPWERRIVHMAASERTDIVTESIGDSDERRVVVKPVSIV